MPSKWSAPKKRRGSEESEGTRNRKEKEWVWWSKEKPNTSILVEAESWYQARDLASVKLGAYYTTVDGRLKEEMKDEPPVYEATDSA